MPRYSILAAIFLIPLSVFLFMSCNLFSPTESRPAETIVLTKASGDNQEAVHGDTLSAPLAVMVTNDKGNALSGRRIDFRIISGGGSLSDSIVVTDDTGKAETTLILGDQEGEVKIEAAVYGTEHSVVFTMRIVLPSKIAFMKSGNIHLMNPDGSNQVELTAGISPSWSPDGTQIAFVTYSDGEGSINIMNADGSNAQRIAEGSKPAWSPNGNLIAFVAFRDGENAIYAIYSDGSNLIKLTSLEKYRSISSLSWSPDGSQIALAEQDNLSGHTNIYLINPVGYMNKSLIVSNRPGYRANSPSWSPDGTKIAYSYGGESLKSDIYIINPYSGDKVNITNNSASSDVTPSWSPDGTQIAFVTYRYGEDEIYIMNTDGSNVQRIAEGSQPAWSPILSR